MNDYQAAPDLLKDRVILITGASDGIGAAVAKACAAHGATVVLLARTIHKLEKVYDEIEAAGGPTPAIYPLNLENATLKDYEDMAATIEQRLGRLDGILHNAAFLGSLTPIEHYNLELWPRVMQINLNAPFLITRTCLPLLQKSDAGFVLFTSSDAGHQGTAYWGAYGVSNAGVENLAQTLADEVENTNLRVNIINPGVVRTAQRAKAFPGEDPNSVRKPDAITATYLYLMGADGRKHHGEVIRI